MKLKKLVKGLDVEIKGSKETEITGISIDSRTVSPGNLFIAKKGSAYDGFQFIPQAVNAGAAAILTDIYDPFLKLPQIIHPNGASLEAKLAAAYYGHPSQELFVLGITGTKGKTSTSYLAKHILDGIGITSGLIGTIETIIQESRFPSALTTHDAITNQKWLKEMVQKGCKGAVLEVSSHGLAQNRVGEIEFDLAVFTNLYPDHLDYHQNMHQYAEAKRELFRRAKRSILNADSPWAAFMGQGVTYGIEKGEIRAENIVCTVKGSRFTVEGVAFEMPLIGRFNVYNALAAIAVGLDRGAKLETLSSVLSSFGSVPARLERIGNIFIDFAHTGEALEAVLMTLKEIGKGRLIAVFGCGGGRDPQRRASMGKAANQWADLSIITNDNPRQEDPQEIARQIASAFSKDKEPLIELDRKKAIEKAIRLAGPDDFVLIAGKGHERVQMFAHQTIPFDDAAVVKEILQEYPVS